jgi:hypothetical protein
MSALRAVASAAVYTGIYCCIYNAWRTISEHGRSLENLEKRVSAIELTYVSVDHCSSDWTGSSRRERVSAMNDEWL